MYTKLQLSSSSREQDYTDAVTIIHTKHADKDFWSVLFSLLWLHNNVLAYSEHAWLEIACLDGMTTSDWICIVYCTAY